MRPRLDRLRAPEWVAGLASLALLVVLFALPWYGLAGAFVGAARQLDVRPATDGFSALTVLGPFAVLVAVLGIGLWWLQATRAAPALPTCVAVLVALLSLALAVGLLVRALNPPTLGLTGLAVGVINDRAGAWIGFGLALLLFAASYRSLRVDGIAEADAPRHIETLRLTPHRPAAGGPAT
jgi:hypothetical protein